jgi:spermidine synthase
VPWAFIVGSNSHDPLHMSANTASAAVRKRVTGALKFYDGITHVGLFNIPKHIRTQLDGEKRVLTKSSPIYFYQ